MPVTLRVAIGLLSIKSLGLVALCAFLIYADVTEPRSEGLLALYVTIFAFAVTAGFILVTRGLARLSSVARGVAIALELLLLAPAYYMITGGLPWLGWPVGIAAAVVIVMLLMTPQTTLR